MTFFWLLVVLLTIALIGIVIFVAGQFFGEEEELISEAEKKIQHGEEEEAVSLLSRVTELNPANFKARWRLAKLLQMTGQPGAAAFHFEYCLENDALPRYVRVQDALVRLAEVYEQQGHYEDAADAWSRYLQQSSDSVEGFFRRGQAFYEIGKYDRAIADYRKIRSDYPEEEPPQTALFLGRSYLRADQPEKAVEYFDEYVSSNPDDLEAVVEAAQSATDAGNLQQAWEWYEHVRERGSENLYAAATLRMVELAFEKEQFERANQYLDELKELNGQDQLTDQQTVHYRYLRAKYLEHNDQHDEAIDLYWDIYEERPEFRDVPDIIEEEIGRMDPDDLLEEFMGMDRDRFVEQCESMTEMMGYQVMNTNTYSPYETNISAREGDAGMETDRILLTFKRWESEVGEWPLREFELNLIEDRYERGIFVAPHGFKKRAHDFVEDSSIRLIGPDTLIQYLREVHKNLQ